MENHGRTWTVPDDEALEKAYLHTHATVAQIAERLGRTPAAVSSRINTHLRTNRFGVSYKATSVTQPQAVQGGASPRVLAGIRRKEKLWDRSIGYFEDRVYMDPNCGCWIWLGAVDSKNGYPRINRTLFGTSWAHRAIYLLDNGSIPERHEVHHKCENALCLNPRHLEAKMPLEHTREHVSRRKQLGQTELDEFLPAIGM